MGLWSIQCLGDKQETKHETDITIKVNFVGKNRLQNITQNTKNKKIIVTEKVKRIYAKSEEKQADISLEMLQCDLFSSMFCPDGANDP